MRLAGDARRRVVLDEILASGEERRLASELVGLRASLADVRGMSRHERAVREAWIRARIGYVANDLSRARARAAVLRASLAE